MRETQDLEGQGGIVTGATVPRILLTRRALLGSAAMTAACTHGSLGPSPVAYSSAHGARPQGTNPPQKVRFNAGDGFVVADLYLPMGYRPEARYPAVAVGGSLSSVKEQMGGTYAAEMAKRGIMALAIDYRHYGESTGEPRQYENPDTKAEDLSAAAAYLASRKDVLPDGVGLLGVCTSGGNVIYAAARDNRIGAIAAVASHLAEPSITPSLPVFGGPEMVLRRRAEGRAARAKYESTGENTLILCYHDADRCAAHVGPMEYYMDENRGGGVPQWKNAFAVMSWEPWLDFDPVRQAGSVTTPALIVHSDGCAMPDQARKVYGLLKGPKAAHWTVGAHFDFYDRPEKVRETADVAADHFHKYLVDQQRERRVHAVRQFFELLHKKDIDAWAALWHEQGTIRVPYPARGFPMTIEGKAEIVRAFRTLFENFDSFESTLMGIYPAADSDAVCVEYENRATLVGGAEYTNDNIAIFRFQDRKIREYHDYFDPRRFQIVVDALQRRKAG